MAAALRSAASKAVHLKVYPRPNNLGESRELLGVLQQFGEVTTFKNLRFDYVQPAPNTCLAIYRDAASAASLLKASPLRFTLEPAAGDQNDAGEPRNEQQTSQSARDDEAASALDPDAADFIGDGEFSIQDGPSKPGADEMIRPSTLLYQTIDAFSHAQPEEPALDSTASGGGSDVSEAARSDDLLASSDADAVDQPEQLHQDPAGPDSTPVAANRHARKAQPPREFHVVVDEAEMNHREHIERSFWYGPYWPRKRTASYIDLTARGVPPGIADVWTKKPEQPIRIIRRLNDELARWPTLREIWEQGQRDRDAQQQQQQQKGESSTAAGKRSR